MSSTLALNRIDLRRPDGLERRRARARLLAEIGGALADAGRDPRVTTWRACPVCGADEPSLRAAFRAPVYDFHRCGDCTLVYTPRMLQPDFVRERFQDTALGARLLPPPPRRDRRGVDPRATRRILDRVLDLAPSRAAALDVGCGFGTLAAALRPRFDETVALELDARVAGVAARRHEVPVRSVRIEELVRSDESLDVDHLPRHPRARSPDARPLLDRSAAPAPTRRRRSTSASAHAESVGMSLLGGAHPLVATHRLIQLFTSGALRALVRAHGFVVRTLRLRRRPRRLGRRLGARADARRRAARARRRPFRRRHRPSLALPSRHGRGARLELVATKGA